MATLKDCIGSIQYDSSWGIWAELIDGKFSPDSQARYGQMIFENGGLLDEFQYFANGVQIGDSYTEWCGDFDITDWNEEFNALVVLYEADTETKWAGDRKAIERWIDEVELELSEVAALVEQAKDKWDEQCSEMSNEWVSQLIDEKNEELVGVA